MTLPIGTNPTTTLLFFCTTEREMERPKERRKRGERDGRERVDTSKRERDGRKQETEDLSGNRGPLVLTLLRPLQAYLFSNLHVKAW